MRSKTLMLLLLLGMAAIIGCRSSADRSTAQTDGGNENKAAPASEPAGDSSADTHAANGGYYKIDSRQSKITAQVGVGGLLSSLGHPHTVSIGGMSGEVQLTPDKIEPVSLNITAKANTASEVNKEFNDSDRQKINEAIRAEALEAAKHQDIALKSTRVTVTKIGEGQYRAQVEGNLTLHGVTRPVQVPTQVALSGTTLRASGKFQIRHSDYQIKRISAAGGAVKASEEITLSFEIVAQKA